MKELYENWQETKAALLEGLAPRRASLGQHSLGVIGA